MKSNDDIKAETKELVRRNQEASKAIADVNSNIKSKPIPDSIKEEPENVLESEESKGIEKELVFDFAENNNDNNSITSFDLSIIPVSSTKIPFGLWKQYQQEKAQTDHWRNHYLNGGYVGVICGRVSGNIECIDIDIKNDPNRTIYLEYRDIIPEELIQNLLIQTTPNSGYHFIYRCPSATIDGNQKLALSEHGEVILETRGESGYFCHHLKDYEVIQGRFDLKNLEAEIPVITPEERQLLLELARSLDRTPVKSGQTFQGYKEPAITGFNASFDIIKVFKKHNWTIYNEDLEKVTLTRPRSNAMYSAYYYRDSKLFVCFSTSTCFKAMQVYNHFQVLKLLEGQDDYHKTLKLLPGYGYELEKENKPKVGANEIATLLNIKGVRYDVFRQDLIFKNDIITENRYNTIYLDLCADLGKDIPRSKFESVIKSLYLEQHHPIKAFIQNHGDRNPTGTFEKWLDCLGLKNKDIDRDIVLHFIKKWMVGLVAQGLDGKYPNEFFLAILSQKQGLGKTTLLRKYLLPLELRDYQAEHALNFTDDYKVLMGQVLLLIDDEMDGRSYDQSQSFKNILSTGTNTTRRKYDRRISAIKRRASFAGSGNVLKVVKERGERRIIPIEVEYIDWGKLDELDLIDMFIEAYQLFQDGFQYSFQPRDKARLNTLYAEHYQESDLDLIIEDTMDKSTESSDTFYITNLDIVNALSVHYPNSTRRINTPNVGKKMAEHGFESRRLGKKKITTYKIGGDSRIIEMLDEKAQSWRLRIASLNGE